MNTSAPSKRPNRLAPDPDATARSTTKGDVPQALLDRYLIERDRQGRYNLAFNDRAGWYGIGSGSTAGECLAIWRPRAGRGVPVL